MKVKEGDYVNVCGMNERQLREVIQAFIDSGAGYGEGEEYVDLKWSYIGVRNGEIWYDDYGVFSGRRLTLQDLLQGTEWNGEGLPPVGCECEYSLWESGEWWKCSIRYVINDGQGVVAYCDHLEEEQVLFIEDGAMLRPAKTEAKILSKEASILSKEANIKLKAAQRVIDAGYKKV